MALFKGKKKLDGDEKKEEKSSDLLRPAGSRPEENLEKDENSQAKGEETTKQIALVTKDIIYSPWITEKAHNSMVENKYIFQVQKKSSKQEIKAAIKSLYNVKVTDINIINIPPKKRMYGRYRGMKSGYKKAIITLRAGDKIELFKEV